MIENKVCIRRIFIHVHHTRYEIIKQKIRNYLLPLK